MANLDQFFKSETADNKTILFIDFHNLIYRTIYVCAAKGKKEMMTQSEMYTYWKYMVINNIINSVKTYTPNRVVVAIDSKSNWRKEIYPEYKENRKVLRDGQNVIDFKEFFPILTEFQEQLKNTFTNFYFIELDRTEADDIVAVLSKSIGKDYKEAIIITNDGDYKQLLKEKHIKIFNPIEKKFVKSLNPQNDLYTKCLIGDKSDNIPSIATRLGKATAKKIIDSGIEDYLIENKLEDIYKRNKILIDWDLIPADIQKNIVEAYNNYAIKPLNSTKLLTFFGSTKIKALAENYSSYSKFISKVG